MTQTKTFKQILEQYKAEFYDDDYPEENSTLCLYHELDVLKAAEKWLKQNQKEINENLGATRVYYYTRLINNLLEDLK